MSILLTDPFDTIVTSVEQALVSVLPTIKYWMHEWPDPTWFEDADVNFPSVLFSDVTTTGAARRSRLQPFATDTSNIYYETLRQQLHIQMTLVTATPDDRVNLGYTLVQSLVNLRQLPLTNGQTSIMRLRNDVSPRGEANYYTRHVTFQFQARVLQQVPGYPAATITSRKTIS